MPFRPRIGRNRSGLLVNYLNEVTKSDNLPDGDTLTYRTNSSSVEWKGTIIATKERRLQLHGGIRILSPINVITK